MCDDTALSSPVTVCGVVAVLSLWDAHSRDVPFTEHTAITPLSSPEDNMQSPLQGQRIDCVQYKIKQQK